MDDDLGGFEIPLEGRDLTRQEVLKYGLVGGATVFFLGAKTASSAIMQVPPAPATKPEKLIIRNWGDPWKSFFAQTAGKTFERATGIPVVWDTSEIDVVQTRIQTAVRAGQRPPSMRFSLLRLTGTAPMYRSSRHRLMRAS